MDTETFNVYSLRTIAITEHQWVALSSTTLEDETLPSVNEARTGNLKTLHRILANQPSTKLGRGTTWRKPTPEMRVTIRETLTKHDVVTGEMVFEDELAEYAISYRSMNPERD